MTWRSLAAAVAATAAAATATRSGRVFGVAATTVVVLTAIWVEIVVRSITRVMVRVGVGDTRTIVARAPMIAL